MPQATYTDLLSEYLMQKGVTACAVTAVVSHPAMPYFLITPILPSSYSSPFVTFVPLISKQLLTHKAKYGSILVSIQPYRVE